MRLLGDVLFYLSPVNDESSEVITFISFIRVIRIISAISLFESFGYSGLLSYSAC
jgi:hypothetical protein